MWSAVVLNLLSTTDNFTFINSINIFTNFLELEYLAYQ
jgi:hypothetical protein